MSSTNEILTLRAQIASLQAQARPLQSVVRSRKEVEQFVREQLEAGASEFRRKNDFTLNLAAHGHDGDAAHHLLRLDADHFEVNTLFLVAGLLGVDAATKAIMAGYEGDPDVLDTPQRLAKLKEIQTELDALERREEALICESETLRAPAVRRQDARPEIVLALPAKAAA